MDLDDFKRVYKKEGSKNLSSQIPFLEQLAKQYEGKARENPRHKWTKTLKVSTSRLHVCVPEAILQKSCKKWFVKELLPALEFFLVNPTQFLYLSYVQNHDISKGFGTVCGHMPEYCLLNFCQHSIPSSLAFWLRG